MSRSGAAPITYFTTGSVKIFADSASNTVDVQMEQANFAENSVRFQATLTFLNGRFRSLMTAITGQ